MEKALRRQAGASDVDLDMEAGIAKLTLGEPAQIDIPALAKDLDDVGYTLKTIELSAKGKLVDGKCAKCGDAPHLELAQSGQRFELHGDPPPKLDGPFRAAIQGWDTDHPQLQLRKEPGS